MWFSLEPSSVLKHLSGMPTRSFVLANDQDVKEMYNINNPKFVYQIVPDERRWQSQQNTFLIVFVKFSTTHNRLVLVCDLTNVVQIYVNNFTVTDNASSKLSFVSALNSKGPLLSSSRRTNWAQISTRKICQCWWRNHTGCVRYIDWEQDLYCAETFHTVSGTKTGHLKVQRQPASAKVQDISDCHSKQVWRCRRVGWGGGALPVWWGPSWRSLNIVRLGPRPCTESVAGAGVLYRDPHQWLYTMMSSFLSTMLSAKQCCT